MTKKKSGAVVVTFDWETATADEKIAEAARRQALRDNGLPLTGHVSAGHVSAGHQAPGVAPRGSVGAIATAGFDRQITLPWDVLVRDNAKYGVMRGRVLLTREYRAGKEAAARCASAQLAGRPPLEGPLELVAAFWEPDQARRRDILNYSKMVNDALTVAGVYVDDSQIDLVTWARAGVDAARPRLELLLRALPARLAPDRPSKG